MGTDSDSRGLSLVMQAMPSLKSKAPGFQSLNLFPISSIWTYMLGVCAPLVRSMDVFLCGCGGMCVYIGGVYCQKLCSWAVFGMG